MKPSCLDLQRVSDEFTACQHVQQVICSKLWHLTRRGLPAVHLHLCPRLHISVHHAQTDWRSTRRRLQGYLFASLSFRVPIVQRHTHRSIEQEVHLACSNNPFGRARNHWVKPGQSESFVD